MKAKLMFKNTYLAILIIFALGFSASAVQAQGVTPPETEAREAIVIDYETGTVLFEKNADERTPTASMSKVLTSIVVYDAINDGKLKPDQELTVSERAWKMGGSRMFLDLGKTAKVDDLIRGVVVQSGNDACVVLAEGIAGSEENFVALLNRKAKDIGMENSNFMNSTGWPDENHYSTVRDLAKMASYLIKNYPDYYKLHSEKEFVYNNIKQGNRNPLLYQSVGADGIKTGHTEAAGYGLIGSAVAGGRRIVMVINGTSSMQARADEAEKLMKWAQLSFKNVNVVKKSDVIETLPVVLGTAREVSVSPAEDVLLTIPAMGKADIQAQATYMSPLVAPIQAGSEIGKLSITLPDGSVKDVALLANADVAEASFFSRVTEKFMLMIVGVPKYQ
jgi:D-alanyl-D-alanine carboxypeptidase (penicillin-binding protein 5/6)